jgi:cytoskeletal protein RodZ
MLEAVAVVMIVVMITTVMVVIVVVMIMTIAGIEKLRFDLEDSVKIERAAFEHVR